MARLLAILIYVGFAPLCLTVFSSCGNGDAPDVSAAAQAEAEAFVSEFCLFRFDEAARHALPEAEAFLKIYASNLTQADIDALTSSRVAPELRGVSLRLISDTLAQATCRLRNVYVVDSIGSVGHFEADATMMVDLQMVGEAKAQWRVRTASLPRSGK